MLGALGVVFGDIGTSPLYTLQDYQVIARYGFMEFPSVPGIVREAARQRFETPVEQATYFLGRENFVATNQGHMPPWREKLFAVMARNATDMSHYFGRPSEQVVEIGSHEAGSAGVAGVAGT